MLTEQKNRRYIPPEIFGEILVKLSLKPLVRCSLVSKSWNSMIFDPDFIRRHCRESNIRIVSHGSLKLSTASSCPISSCIDNATPPIPANIKRKRKRSTDIVTTPYGSIYCRISSDDNATPLIFPFNKAEGHSGVGLLASCGELWCVHHANSIFLWNPSTTSYKKLPRPSVKRRDDFGFGWGLGYDSLSDDYKIVKHTQLYSLRSDSWRPINQPLPFHGRVESCELYGGVACNGALHWVLRPAHVIISFNLSTEKYDELAMPSHPDMKLAVLRGKLCLYDNLHNELIIWEMQEYGVAKSWTKKFVISHHTLVPAYYDDQPKQKLVAIPLYFYDDGRLLIKTHYSKKSDIPKGLNQETLFIYKDNNTLPQTVLSCTCGDRYVGDDNDIGHLYVESLVSPTTYCTRPQPPS